MPFYYYILYFDGIGYNNNIFDHRGAIALRERRQWGIRKKTLAGIIAITLLIMVLSCIGGSIIFDRAIEKQYNDKGYMVANIILNDIDHDKIAEYATTWKTDDYYREMVLYLHEMEAFSNAAYIYIAVPYENKTMRYIYDSDTFIGDSDPIAASFDEIWKVYTEGVRPKSYLKRNSKKYGYLTSSCLPVIDSKGNIVALLFVDTYMDVVLTTLLAFVLEMIIISIVLLTLYCIVSWGYLKKNLIDPLMIIGRNVRIFANSGAQTDDTLNNIRTNDELQDLAESVSAMENDIVEYIENIKSITAEKERIGAELSVAARIQADMLPRVFPPFPERNEFDIYATMTPAKEVGGDFYDFFFVDEKHLALVIADVSGKGVPAALFMVNAKNLVKNRAIARGCVSPGEILFDINNQMCEGNVEEFFVTMWLCIIDLSTGKGAVANAGHEHPAVMRKGGKFELDIYKHSIALAVYPNIKFADKEFQMEPGDAVFVYTDGVTEATDAEMTLFGNDRLISALNKDPNARANKILSNVKADIDSFVGDIPQFDDITMMGFRYLGQ